MAFVYWIHLPEHTDITSEGYIGFTSKTVSFRFGQHVCYSGMGKAGHLYNAMRKYGNTLVVDTLVEGTSDYCLMIENKLRPKQKTGWNAGIGGESTMIGYEHSEETKQKMSEASPTKGKRLDLEYVEKRAASRKSLGLKHSDEAKRNLSEARLRLNLPPWRNPAANLSVWAQCETVFDYMKSGAVGGQYITEKALGFRKDKLSVIYKKLKAGWNPSQDEAYQKWLQEYKEAHVT